MVPFLNWKACARHRVRKCKENLQKVSKRMGWRAPGIKEVWV